MKFRDLLARVAGVKPVAITEPSLSSTAVSPPNLTRAITFPVCTAILSSRRRNKWESLPEGHYYNFSIIYQKEMNE
jgi:hypothetical protein